MKLLESKGVLRLIAGVLCAIALWFMFFGQSGAARTLTKGTLSLRGTMTPSVANPYDPAVHGVPETLAGYRVLAVLTPDNTACMPLGVGRLVLQADQDSLEEHLKVGQLIDIGKALEQHDLRPDQWVIQVVGPGVTLEELIAENESWNEEAVRLGCVQIGHIRMSSRDR